MSWEKKRKDDFLDCVFLHHFEMLMSWVEKDELESVDFDLNQIENEQQVRDFKEEDFPWFVESLSYHDQTEQGVH